MDCAIVMERVLFFRSALSFRHAPRATSLSEGGSIAPRETDPYNYAVLCGYKISKKTNFRDHFGSWVPK